MLIATLIFSILSFIIVTVLAILVYLQSRVNNSEAPSTYAEQLDIFKNINYSTDWLKQRAQFQLFSNFTDNIQALSDYANSLLEMLEQKDGLYLPNRDILIQSVDDAIDTYLFNTNIIDIKSIEKIRSRLEKILLDHQAQYNDALKTEYNNIVKEYSSFINKIKSSNSEIKLVQTTKKFQQYRDNLQLGNFAADQRQDIRSRAQGIEEGIVNQQAKLLAYATNKSEEEVLSKLEMLLAKLKKLKNVGSAKNILSEAALIEQKINIATLTGKSLQRYIKFKNNFEETFEKKVKKTQQDTIVKYSTEVLNNCKKVWDEYSKQPRNFKKNYPELKKLLAKYNFHKVDQGSLSFPVASYFSHIWGNIFAETNNDSKLELAKWINKSAKDSIL